MDPKDFTAEDWYEVIQGMGAVTGLVVASDMSGPVGFVKEASASADVLRDAKWQTPFIAALRAEVLAPTKERQEELLKLAQAKGDELKGQQMDRERAMQSALDALRKSVAFVEEKAGPAAAAEFRQALGEMAQKTAEAANEGGFLGIGSVQVSKGELAALDQISTLR